MNFIKFLFFSPYNKLIRKVNGAQPLDPKTLQDFLEPHNYTQQYRAAFSRFFSQKGCFRGSRIFNAIFKTFRWRWLFVILSKIVLTILLVLTPTLTNHILHLAKDKNPWNLLILLLLILIQKGIKTFLSVHVNFQQVKIGCLLYGQLALLLYDKPTGNSGKLLSLLEQDSYRMINLAYFLIQMFIIPVQICYSVYILCWTIGISNFNAHFVIFSFYLLMCILLAVIEKSLNTRLMEQKDMRNAAVLALLQQDGAPSEAIHARNNQLGTQLWLFVVEIIGRSLSSIICSVILVVSLVILSGSISQSQMFSLILLFNQLRYPCILFPTILSNFIHNYVAICRIEQFMETVDIDHDDSRDDIELYQSNHKVTVARRVVQQLYKYQHGQYNNLTNVRIEDSNDSQQTDTRYHFIMCIMQQIEYAKCIILDNTHYTQLRQHFQHSADSILSCAGVKLYTSQNIHIHLQDEDQQTITVYRPAISEHNQNGAITFQTLWRYVRQSGVTYLFFLFVVAVILSQSLSVYSSIIYRRESSQRQIVFHIHSLMFVVPFVTVVPTAVALTSILCLSWKSSKSTFQKIIRRIQLLINKYNKSVLSNRLANDLKFFDRSAALFIYDIFNSSMAIIGTLTLCLYSLSSHAVIWMLLMLGFLIMLSLLMSRWSSMALSTLRQCLRCQATYRSKSIKQLYDNHNGHQAVKYLGITDINRNRFIEAVDLIVKTHITVTSVETWMQLRLLLLSFVACWAMSGVCVIGVVPGDVIGIILAYSLTLDDMIQGWFLSRVNVEKSLIAVQRIIDLV